MIQTINPCTNTTYNRSNPIEMQKDFTIVIVSYQGYYEIETIINAFLSQKLNNWNIIVAHDGFDERMQNIMNKYINIHNNIKFIYSEKRANKWGHNLRNLAMKHITTDYVVNTNDDNYYVPTYSTEIHNVIKQNKNIDVITYNCIHSYFGYGVFGAQMKSSRIDMGQFVIKTNILKDIKFDINKANADGVFINNVIKKYNPSIKHIKKNLFVHN